MALCKICTKLEVVDIRGQYYICRNEDVDSIFIQKELCEVEEDDRRINQENIN